MLAGNTVTIRRKSALAHPARNALPAGRRPLLICTITDQQMHSCSDHQLRIFSSTSQRTSCCTLILPPSVLCRPEPPFEHVHVEAQLRLLPVDGVEEPLRERQRRLRCSLCPLHRQQLRLPVAITSALARRTSLFRRRQLLLVDDRRALRAARRRRALERAQIVPASGRQLHVARLHERPLSRSAAHQQLCLTAAVAAKFFVVGCWLRVPNCEFRIRKSTFGGIFFCALTKPRRSIFRDILYH